MKLLIASDIHGSAQYCKQLLEAYRQEKAERLVLLGDVLYHGPRNDLPQGYEPKKVITMLNAIVGEIICVNGNCDAEVDQMVLDFILQPGYTELEDSKRTLYFTHGHHLDDAPPPARVGDVVFYGHTHVPAFFSRDGVVYINPGSVSIPKEGSQRGYIIYENSKVAFKNLEGETFAEYEI